ncbi:hypothetical protein [Enterococcus malodoratus]|uniref:hypothetical protein n=1 Tax=Enterococcus malodoratus TaxID=71451 RepID=UPI00215C5F1B|nr:hypothetical protein [Enterococcus malodoratus]
MYYRYLNGWYTFFFSIPTLSLAAWLWWKNWTNIVSVIDGNQKALAKIIMLGILVSGLLFLTIAVSLFAMKRSKENGGYFSRLQRCQWLLKYLIENNLVDIKKVKTETGSKELIQLPKVYYKKRIHWIVSPSSLVGKIIRNF